MSKQSNIAGAGVGLPLPQALYPFNPGNAPVKAATNQITLSGGESYLLPGGTFFIGGAKNCIYQALDPITGTWRVLAGNLLAPNLYQSDGANFRIFNPTGCVVAAIVTAGGQAYAQATATATVSTGNAVLACVVGNNVATITVVSGGTGYTLPPNVYISAPPPGGVPATAYASLTSGGVTSITLLNQGAGYTAGAPTVTLQPNPLDPAYTSITSIGSATANLSGGSATSGKITAILVTNPGQTVSAAPAITISGGSGVSATATAVWCSTVTGVVSSAGGTGAATAFLITSLGGLPSGNTFNNPLVELTGIVPRQMQASGVASAGVLTSPFTIYDPGLFFGTVTPIVIASGGVVSAAAGAVTFTTGAANDSFFIQEV